jgi:hypothetical protein
MLFLVVSLFLICWFPLQLYNYLNVNKPEINEYILSINQIKISRGFFFVIVLNILLFYGYVQIGLLCRIHAIIHLFMVFVV